MCDEELPSDLNKLEIGPQIPQIKLCDSQLPVSLNPFYNKIIQDSSGQQLGTDVIFGDIKCSCRVRRRSESVLDECKSSNTNSTFGRIEHSIKNSTQFKRKNRKKVLLRDPILKSLQKCLHPKHLKAFGDIPNRLLKKSASNDSMAGAGDGFTKSCPTIEALNVDDSLGFLRISSEEPSTSSGIKSGITDFRDLIDECQSLLETNFSFDSWNNSIASRKSLKPFSVIQLAENRSSQRIRHCSEKNHKTREDRSKGKEGGTARHSGSSNASTSCSQQARINTTTVTAAAAAGGHSSSVVAGATSPCDVTIDELASYFETFVHIPKKMSSMAEMMYI